jgi:hypothetical protein
MGTTSISTLSVQIAKHPTHALISFVRRIVGVEIAIPK